MRILSEFGSHFNTSINSRSRAFKIIRSNTSTALLKLLYENGYILGFTLYSADIYLVYPNHIAISFHLKLFYKSSNKVTYNLKDFKVSSNRGYRYIVRTPIGFFFSDTLIANKLGGQPIYYLHYFS